MPKHRQSGRRFHVVRDPDPPPELSRKSTKVVVIDLLSDTDEEDEPPVAPKAAAAKRRRHTQRDIKPIVNDSTGYNYDEDRIIKSPPKRQSLRHSAVKKENFQVAIPDQFARGAKSERSPSTSVKDSSASSSANILVCEHSGRVNRRDHDHVRQDRKASSASAQASKKDDGTGSDAISHSDQSVQACAEMIAVATQTTVPQQHAFATQTSAPGKRIDCAVGSMSSWTPESAIKSASSTPSSSRLSTALSEVGSATYDRLAVKESPPTDVEWQINAHRDSAGSSSTARPTQLSHGCLAEEEQQPHPSDYTFVADLPRLDQLRHAGHIDGSQVRHKERFEDASQRKAHRAGIRVEKERRKNRKAAVTCHHCRRKKDDLMRCRNHEASKVCRKKFCESCLSKYYGQQWDPDSVTFQCPSCSGFCTCIGCLDRSEMLSLYNSVVTDAIGDEIRGQDDTIAPAHVGRRRKVQTRSNDGSIKELLDEKHGKIFLTSEPGKLAGPSRSNRASERPRHGAKIFSQEHRDKMAARLIGRASTSDSDDEDDEDEKRKRGAARWAEINMQHGQQGQVWARSVNQRFLSDDEESVIRAYGESTDAGSSDMESGSESDSSTSSRAGSQHGDVQVVVQAEPVFTLNEAGDELLHQLLFQHEPDVALDDAALVEAGAEEDWQSAAIRDELDEFLNNVPL